MRKATWTPDPAAAQATRMADFRRAAESRSGRTLTATPELHAWSVEDPAGFWRLVWDYFDVVGGPAEPAHTPSTLPDAIFFPKARINLAENLLARWTSDDDVAVVAVGEGEGALGVTASLSGAELRGRVGAFASALRHAGVRPGDRVGLILPVGTDALVCTIGALAVGAVVSSVSPEFGAPSILDRLGQLEPVLLVVAPSYRWAGRQFHRSANIVEVVNELPSVRSVLVSGPDALDRGPRWRADCSVQSLAQVLADPQEPVFEELPFDHPAYVLFSSGTTGKPKCLIHRGGGVLLKHLVELGLHSDVKAGDRLLFYTTTSWMMWNWEVSCLALGATLVLHDGAPTYPDSAALVDSARITAATHLGLGARLVDAMRQDEVDLRARIDFAHLREVLVTGSPLSEMTAEWLAGQLGPSVMINPISGGTDLVGCFIAGDPTRPFYAGEMTGPVLGVAVDVFNDSAARAADGEIGELVCTAPFPTVPVGIWGDASGERLRQAYFDHWPGVWVHGDRSVRSAEGGIAILGRSDATLNVGGVRIGTSELYAALADHPAVADVLAFGQEQEVDTRIVLLVVPSTGVEFDDALRSDLRSVIRQRCSPRHVPAVIVAVPDLPRTQTGKLSEIAAREAVHGRPVPGIGALANPGSLDAIVLAVQQA